MNKIEMTVAFIGGLGIGTMVCATTLMVVISRLNQGAQKNQKHAQALNEETVRLLKERNVTSEVMVDVLRDIREELKNK